VLTTATVTVGGWTVGGGIEAAISPNWSAKVEYLHVDLGNPRRLEPKVQLGPPAGADEDRTLARLSRHTEFRNPRCILSWNRPGGVV
jgi:opacity protein-like surface antigen